MPKYIKREIVDLNAESGTRAYYCMQTLCRLDPEEFVERVHSYNGAYTKSTIVGVMAAVRDQIVRELANGYTVGIDGLGTFGSKLGLQSGKEMDGFEAGEAKHNALSIKVTDVTFRADKSMVRDVDSECSLERGGVNRLRPSKLTPEERVQCARNYLHEQKFMRVADYADLTGLSYTTAARELRKVGEDPSSGITSKGVKSAKLYMLAE